MGRRKKGNKVDGWINLYKPKGMGSTQAVGKIRYLLNAQKAGHAGTLDPLAEGILPIALGEATKTISFMQDEIKTYEFDVVWGEARNTDDAEGEVIETSEARPAKEAISAALSLFVGHIEQIPPKFSAIKIDGERAYNLARNDEDIQMKPRQVYIESFKLISTTNERASFEVICGKGTYIRALGRDLALKLGTVGYIDNLIRTQVGTFTKENAFFLDKEEENRHKEALNEALLPVDESLDDIPDLDITDSEASKLRQGQVLSLFSKTDSHRIDQLDLREDKIARVYLNDQCIGLVEIDGIRVQPKKLFNI